jgi:hypothetical protein
LVIQNLSIIGFQNVINKLFCGSNKKSNAGQISNFYGIHTLKKEYFFFLIQKVSNHSDQ